MDLIIFTILAALLLIALLSMVLHTALYRGFVGRTWRETLLEQRDERMRQEYKVQVETLEFENRLTKARLEDTLDDLVASQEKIETLEATLIELITNIGKTK